MTLITHDDAAGTIHVLGIETAPFTLRNICAAIGWAVAVILLVFTLIIAGGYVFYGNAPHVGASALQALI